MAQQSQDSAICDAVKLFKDNGFEALAEAVAILLNTALGCDVKIVIRQSLSQQQDRLSVGA